MLYKFDDLFRVTKYPAGEPHVQLRGTSLFTLIDNPDPPPPVILFDAMDFNDLCIMRLADEILGRRGFSRRQWLVPYFPFARHDRRNDRNDSNPLQLAIDLVKGLNIVTVDPHSDVAGHLPHYTQKQVVALFKEVGLFDRDEGMEPVIAIPDAGATKKAYSWINQLDYVQCLKRRDPATGKLSGFQVVKDGTFIDRPVVIVDDICDAGGTFLALANKLIEKDAGDLRLAVTHGLFTKGLDELFKKFSIIYTLDTCTLEHERLVKVPVENLLRSEPL